MADERMSDGKPHRVANINSPAHSCAILRPQNFVVCRALVNEPVVVRPFPLSNANAPVTFIYFYYCIAFGRRAFKLAALRPTGNLREILRIVATSRDRIQV